MFRDRHSGKGQIQGHHKPKMLADQLRRRAPKKADKKPKNKVVPQDIQQLTPFINIDFSKLSWPVILIMLILIPSAFANSNIFRLLIDGMSVNDRSVELLPSDARCQSNSVGTSRGEICEFNGASHYVKLFKPQAPEHIKPDGLHISYEEYNRRFVKNNIGIDVVDVNYYVKTAGDKNLYQASKQVNGLMFTQYKKATNKQLGKAGIAKWAVATTFIFDLNSKNVGYTSKGIVMVDLDGYEQLPRKSLGGNMIMAAVGIFGYSPELSLRDLDQMIEIYREMQKKPLPIYHDEFNMTDQMYQRLLKQYIFVCEKTKKLVKQSTTNLPHTERTNVINQTWCELVKKQINESEHHTKLYQDLCVHRNLG